MIGALAMLAAATPVPPVTTLNERPPFGRSIATSAAEPGAPRLTGIVTTPNGPIASLKDSTSGLASWVSVGGSFAGWTLESASDDLRSAVLRRDGKTITVSNWSIPPEVIEEKDEFIKWINKSYEVALKVKTRK